MTTINADSMHRLAKLALDTGEASSPEEALKIFSQYRLRVQLGKGWADTIAGQACFLTLLNAGVRAFIGGIEVVGDLDHTLKVPLFDGRQVSDVIIELGGCISATLQSTLPTLIIGEWASDSKPEFCIQLQWNAWYAELVPAGFEDILECINDNALSGVAAAALGLNEAFMYVRRDSPLAGHRKVGFSIWHPLASDQAISGNAEGPALEFLPSSLWIIGLGHLGQAYAWMLGMLPYEVGARPHLMLQDFDVITESNQSTCMLVSPGDVGKRKARAIADRLESAGFSTSIIERRFIGEHKLAPNEPLAVLLGVDNIVARQALDSGDFGIVVEAGLGSGYSDFRNIRIHTFPGQKLATEVWTAASAVQKEAVLGEVYKNLAIKEDDLCGVTLLATRAVATPFVGVLASTLVVGELVRLLHGGDGHSVIDFSMKDVRFCTGAINNRAPTLPPFVKAMKRGSSTAADTSVSELDRLETQ